MENVLIYEMPPSYLTIVRRETAFPNEGQKSLICNLAWMIYENVRKRTTL